MTKFREFWEQNQERLNFWETESEALRYLDSESKISNCSHFGTQILERGWGAFRSEQVSFGKHCGWGRCLGE